MQSSIEHDLRFSCMYWWIAHAKMFYTENHWWKSVKGLLCYQMPKQNTRPSPSMLHGCNLKGIFPCQRWKEQQFLQLFSFILSRGNQANSLTQQTHFVPFSYLQPQSEVSKFTTSPVSTEACISNCKKRENDNITIQKWRFNRIFFCHEYNFMLCEKNNLRQTKERRKHKGLKEERDEIP